MFIKIFMFTDLSLILLDNEIVKNQQNFKVFNSFVEKKYLHFILKQNNFLYKGQEIINFLYTFFNLSI